MSVSDKVKLKFFKDPSRGRRVLHWVYGKSAYVAPGLLVGATMDSMLAMSVTYALTGLMLIPPKSRDVLKRLNSVFDRSWLKHKHSEYVSDRLREVFDHAKFSYRKTEERKGRDGKIEKVEVVEYPRVNIEMDGNNYYLRVEMLPGQTAKQWEQKQDAFAHALSCDFVSFKVKRGVVEMILQHTSMKSDKVLYKEDREARYINIGYAPGRILKWNFDDLPHMLVVGVTGSGKSTFIRNLLVQMGRTWTLKIVDGKTVEFSFLKRMGYDVVTSKNELLQVLEEAEKEMDRRYRKMDELGVNEYHQAGFTPYFVLVDEFITLVESMRSKPRRGSKEQGIKGEDKSEKDKLFEYLHKLSTKGRASGVFLILILQRPDSTFMPTAVRDNLIAKVVLKGSEAAMEMAFGSEYKRLSPLPKGQGYCQLQEEPVAFAFANYQLDQFKEDMVLPEESEGESEGVVLPFEKKKA
jgi:energy-coupling factor transporter ATP-binding protein EcfA2